MSKLFELHQRTLSLDGMSRLEAECDLVEEMTFASAEELLVWIDTATATTNDLFAVPIWLRTLAFRLACLQRPNDPVLLRRAADDLEFYGPDWDEIAADLKKRAEALELEQANKRQCVQP